jgi:malonyl-CoA O-methyltransferase
MDFFFRRRNVKVLSPLEAYNQWAASYLYESNPVKNLSDELVEKMLPSLNGKRMLDAGCGPGKFCKYAAEQKAANIVGVDLSPAMIEEARKHCPSGDFRISDLSAISFPKDNFDVIICALSLGHLEQLKPALQKLVDTLDHGGSLIITDFHPFLTLTQAKRTFRDPATGKQAEVRHYLHLFEEYVASFVENNVSIQEWAEPLFNGVPVVFGIRVKKS